MTRRLPARSLLGGVLGVLLGALLAGCVSVPDSGPVQMGPGSWADVEDTQQYVRAPKGPAPGADPAEIVRGYLAAMRALPADPSVVRQFLTEQAAAEWRPDSGTVVFSASPVLRISGSLVQTSFTQLGTLDERGSWQSTPTANAGRVISLQLTTVHGEWRIRNPVPGMLIDQEFFDDYFRPYSLYFFHPTDSILVPEQVYLPDGDQTATALLRGLQRGPTRWLRGAVDSFVPAPTEGTATVPVDANGVATVRLPSEVQDYSPEERELVAVQLAWTLGQVNEVRQIRVVADGAPVSLVRDPGGLDAEYGSKYDPADAGASRDLYALHEGRVVVVTGEQVRPLQGAFGTGDVPVESFGVDRSGRVIAGVLSDGSTVAVADSGADASQLEVWFDGGTKLLAPQWDVHDRLWLVDRRWDGAAIWAVQDGEPIAVVQGGGPAAPRDIRAFAVARDGARIAVIDGRGAQARLVVGRIARDARTEGLRVDRWRTVVAPMQPLSRFRALAWASPTQLAVIAVEEESHQPVAVDIDGSDVVSSALVDFDPRWIAATPTQDAPTVVGDARGRLYSQTSNERWSPVVLDAEDPDLVQPTYVE